MSKTETTSEQLETLKIAQAEARVIAKHGDRVIEGSAQREPSGKISVEIRTYGVDGEYDGNTRRVATSDVHQVFHMPEVKKELDRAKARDRRGPSKGEAARLRALLEQNGIDPDVAEQEDEAEFDLG